MFVFIYVCLDAEEMRAKEGKFKCDKCEKVQSTRPSCRDLFGCSENARKERKRKFEELWRVYSGCAWYLNVVAKFETWVSIFFWKQRVRWEIYNDILRTLSSVWMLRKCRKRKRCWSSRSLIFCVNCLENYTIWNLFDRWENVTRKISTENF